MRRYIPSASISLLLWLDAGYSISLCLSLMLEKPVRYGTFEFNTCCRTLQTFCRSSFKFPVVILQSVA